MSYEAQAQLPVALPPGSWVTALVALVTIAVLTALALVGVAVAGRTAAPARRPTPPGATVTCTTRVIQVEDRQFTFQVEARDGHEVIARGLHKRAVIRVGSFARRLAAKSAALNNVAAG